MTPTLRKLYHRRGKLLSYLNEIDNKIAELTPEEGDLVVYDDGVFFLIGIYFEKGVYRHSVAIRDVDISHITILEKGFER